MAPSPSTMMLGTERGTPRRPRLHIPPRLDTFKFMAILHCRACPLPCLAPVSSVVRCLVVALGLDLKSQGLDIAAFLSLEIHEYQAVNLP